MTRPQLDLSVVIASHNSGPVIAQCLDALSTQEGTSRMEIIVADSSDDGTEEIVRDRFPQVRLLHFAEPLTVPELRAKAIESADGAIVAVLDPYSIAAADWAVKTVAAHRRKDNPVIGGSVDKHADMGQGLLAWTLYFNEYGLFMPPVAGGSTTLVPGSNVSYKRAVLFEGSKARHAVFWKTFVNQETAAAGHALWLDPEIRISLNKPIPFGDYLHTRFFHGRCYAAMRVADSGRANRWLRAASTPLVPILLCARWTRGIWPKRRERLRYLMTLPLQLALFSVWASGELCGYLYGCGGSCRRLYY
jgi:glycosyltransferase involved in cell wall biosynthesis